MHVIIFHNTMASQFFIILFLKILLSLNGFELNTIIHRSVSCDNEFFHVNIMFNTVFHGVIQTENSHPRCIYIDGLTEPNKVYNFKVPLQSCGSETSWNDDGSTAETKNIILIQRTHGLVDQWDSSISLLCHRNINQEAVTEIVAAKGQLDIISPPEDIILQQADLPSDAVHFSSRIVEGNDVLNPTVKGQVLLGEQLTYVFTCRPSTGAIPRDCTVGECWARDPQGEVAIQLSDSNGCSKHHDFWTDFSLISDGVEKVFTSNIWAWSFPTANSVLISCQLRVCPEKCQTNTCHHLYEFLAEVVSDALPPSAQEDTMVDTQNMNNIQSSQIINNSHHEALVSFSVQREKSTYSRANPSYPNKSIQKEDAAETYCISTVSFATLMAVLLTTLAVLTVAVSILLCKLFHLVSRENLLYSRRSGNPRSRRIWNSLH